MIESRSRIGSYQGGESSKATERSSVDNVLTIITNPLVFPWVEGYRETVPNGHLDAREKIDAIIYTGDQFARITGMDSIAIQIKSSEIEMNQFLGMVSRSEKPHKIKFLKHTNKEWSHSTLTYLNGQWGDQMIAADFMFQICALNGYWPDGKLIDDFSQKCFSHTGQQLMRSSLPLIRDYRGRFLNWISQGTLLC